MANSFLYWFAAFVLVGGGAVTAWSYAPEPSQPPESEITTTVATSSGKPEILTDEQMRELEAKSLENSQEASELERAKQELQAYFAQQARQKEARERLDFEAKMLMLEKGAPMDGPRYFSDVYTTYDGDILYSDNYGNRIECRNLDGDKGFCSEL